MPSSIFIRLFRHELVFQIRFRHTHSGPAQQHTAMDQQWQSQPSHLLRHPVTQRAPVCHSTTLHCICLIIISHEPLRPMKNHPQKRFDTDKLFKQSVATSADPPSSSKRQLIITRPNTSDINDAYWTLYKCPFFQSEQLTDCLRPPH